MLCFYLLDLLLHIICCIFYDILSVGSSTEYYLLDLLQNIICWIFYRILSVGSSTAYYLLDFVPHIICWIFWCGFLLDLLPHIICWIFCHELSVGSSAAEWLESCMSQSPHCTLGVLADYQINYRCLSVLRMGLPVPMLFKPQPSPVVPSKPWWRPVFCFHCLQFGSVFTINPLWSQESKQLL